MRSYTVPRKRVRLTTRDGQTKTFLAKRYQHTERPFHKLSPSQQAISVCATARRDVSIVPRGFMARCPARVMSLGPIKSREDYARALTMVYADFSLEGRATRGMKRAFASSRRRVRRSA